MMRKFVNPTIKIQKFGKEQVVASDYIQAVQDYLQTVTQGETVHKRMELFLELLEYNE